MSDNSGGWVICQACHVNLLFGKHSSACRIRNLECELATAIERAERAEHNGRVTMDELGDMRDRAERAEAKLAALKAEGHPKRIELEFTLSNAKNLLDFFGGEESDVTVAYMKEGEIQNDPTDPTDDGPCPAGMYAWCSEYPEEGCCPLFDSDRAATPEAK